MDSENMNKDIFNLPTWLSLNDKEQDEAIRKLADYLKDDYQFLYTKNYDSKVNLRIPTFEHSSTKLEFNLIIGGTFEMGLSLQEEKNARVIEQELPFPAKKMRPVHQVHIRPFLLTRFPLTEAFVRSHIVIDENLFRPEFGEIDEVVPIYLSREETDLLKSKTGFDLPSEAQWEYACRGQTTSLFYFGDTFPDEDSLESIYLLYNFTDPVVCERASNMHPYGLVGLFIGEWCEDSYKNNYSYLPLNDTPNFGGPPYSVRGGAAPLWPWQDAGEWQLCMSAMRNSSDTLEDETCGARFIRII
jgi:formylglycine-generating enzyme required for sulfatase activity